MTILQKIIEYKKEEVAHQKKGNSLHTVKSAINFSSTPINFYEILQNYKQKPDIAVIAEVKKASPSKGLIRADFDHIEIAKIYEKAGAAAISILTDEKFFQGKIDYFLDIRKITSLPLLRKDFIIDEYQIYQTRSMNADIILLIAAALDKKQLKDYFDLSKELGLNVLLEVHDKEEFDLAVETGAKIIGINNRNLKTFEVNLQNTLEIIKNQNLSEHCIISESGISKPEDIKLLKENRISGVLIGEAFTKNKNIEKAYFNLIK